MHRVEPSIPSPGREGSDHMSLRGMHSHIHARSCEPQGGGKAGVHEIDAETQRLWDACRVLDTTEARKALNAGASVDATHVLSKSPHPKNSKKYLNVSATGRFLPPRVAACLVVVPLLFRGTSARQTQQCRILGSQTACTTPPRYRARAVDWSQTPVRR